MPRKKKQNPDDVTVTKKEKESQPKTSEYSQLAVKGKGEVGSSIEFWTRRELNRKGEPMSSYPLGYNQRMMSELEEEIKQIEHSLSDPFFTAPHEREERKQRLNDLKNKRKDIEAMAPGNLSGIQKDFLADLRKDFGEIIADFEPTYDQMNKGTVNAQELMKKYKGKTIPVAAKYRPFVEKLGGKMYNGKMGGDDFKRIWKLAGWRLGEETNTEILRRQGGATGVHQSEHEIVGKVIDKIRQGYMRDADPEYAEWLDRKKDK